MNDRIHFIEIQIKFFFQNHDMAVFPLVFLVLEHGLYCTRKYYESKIFMIILSSYRFWDMDRFVAWKFFCIQVRILLYFFLICVIEFTVRKLTKPKVLH